MLNGHTPHSSKCGVLQAEAAAGKQVPELLKDACMHENTISDAALSGPAPPCQVARNNSTTRYMLASSLAGISMTSLLACKNKHIYGLLSKH